MKTTRRILAWLIGLNIIPLIVIFGVFVASTNHHLFTIYLIGWVIQIALFFLIIILYLVLFFIEWLLYGTND
jgi:hypothetical protein